jgi:hypothetical protein
MKRKMKRKKKMMNTTGGRRGVSPAGTARRTAEQAGFPGEGVQP